MNPRRWNTYFAKNAQTEKKYTKIGSLPEMRPRDLFIFAMPVKIDYCSGI
jgi:hypothetical protein